MADAVIENAFAGENGWANAPRRPLHLLSKAAAARAAEETARSDRAWASAFAGVRVEVLLGGSIGREKGR